MVDQITTDERLRRAASAWLVRAQSWLISSPSLRSSGVKALAGSSAVPPRLQFALRRALDAWEYGSGADFKL